LADIESSASGTLSAAVVLAQISGFLDVAELAADGLLGG
jgi:hypothetical protein